MKKNIFIMIGIMLLILPSSAAIWTDDDSGGADFTNIPAAIDAGFWNATELVTYTYNGAEYAGYPGNFWSGYSGEDADGDGIIDTPTVLPSDLGTDYEPLIGAWSDGEILGGPTVPVADYTADLTSGTAPLTVPFMVQSTGDGITAWAWDFENDDMIDNITQNATHTYTTAGSYTVNLTVTNATGSDSEVKADYITVTDPVLPVLNVNTGLRYATIQAAVTAATAGDEIIVGDGSYTENVNVDKQLIIRSENGSTSVMVTAASPTLPVFDVNANAITIDGLTVCGPTNEHVAGIEIVDFNDCYIVGNDCSGCYNGIHIGGTGTNNTVEENYCHGNTRRGISVRDTAHDNDILKNIMEGNTDAGICIKDSAQDNVLWLNDVISNRVEILTANTAHSPDPITYLYNGGTSTGYLGNYYSDYSGTDPDGDGVGAPSYSYGTGGDDYPLMAQSVNYVETELPPSPELLWGPYLTGTTTTGTIVNAKTTVATNVTVEYTTDAYYAAHAEYDQSATDSVNSDLHHVALSGLAPDTLYHYRVVYDGHATGDFHFRTFPETGVFTFVVYSDTQDQLPTFSQLERHKLVADRIAEEPGVSFVLNSGDLVNNASNVSDWDRYFAAGNAMMASGPVFPALGNHDRYDPYAAIYGIPEYYSFDCADVHITVLNSNDWAWPDLPTQSAWLAADLQAEKPFKFVSFHHPIYSSDAKHFGGWENLRQEWEDDFNENGILAVFNGHVHAYERLVVNNTNYFVAGIGGGPSYNLADPRYEASVNSLEYMIGYTRVTIDPEARTATAEVIRVADVSPDLKNLTTVYPPNTVFETVVMALPELPLTVKSPNGGETWQLGSTQSIQWSYTESAGSLVKIEVLRGETVIATIPSVPIGTGGTGFYNLTVPSGTPLCTDYLIRVTSTSDPAITDTSNGPFTISSPIKVVSPDGGEDWQLGSAQSIQWSYAESAGSSVKIEALRGETVIATIPNVPIGTGGSGFYNLTVPSRTPVGDNYRFRVTSTSNPVYTDTSNAPFTISPDSGSSITIVSPDGGEIWTQGTEQFIHWTCAGNPGSTVTIEFLKGSSVLKTVMGVSLSSGSYRVPVPYGTPPGDDYQVRITSTSNPVYTDTSAATFTVQSAIKVVSPNGREDWQLGSAQSIQWSYAESAGDSVKIEALRGETVIATIPNVPIGTGGSGFYNLTVPSNTPLGDEYRIRVTSSTHNACTDTSDMAFFVVGDK